MMKVGITLDDWKLPVFEQKLNEAGFEYENKGYLCQGSIVLTAMVEESDLKTLHGVIKECQRLAHKRKKKLKQIWKEKNQ